MRAAPVLVCLLAAACSSPSPPPAKPHHTAGGFRNTTPYEPAGLLDFLKWRWQRLGREIPGPEAYHFERVEPAPDVLRGRAGEALTWIGHATVLVQTAGVNLLTDPHFSARASPVQWAGPRRAVPPGIALSALPPIDIVLISHDHYDSLDAPSVRALRARPGGDRTVFCVPLGLKRWFEELGVQQVVEMDWWEQRTVRGVRITAVPAQHWSKRSLWGRNQTLWSGWAVHAPQLAFYFAGDTGFGPHFEEIGARLGPFDLAAIPIGAYEPRWFMARHHLNPEEAVRVHRAVRARRSVAVHWGTFVLTDEPLDEPPRRLARAARQAGLGEGEFRVLRHGETLRLDRRQPGSHRNRKRNEGDDHAVI